MKCQWFAGVNVCFVLWFVYNLDLGEFCRFRRKTGFCWNLVAGVAGMAGESFVSV